MSNRILLDYSVLFTFHRIVPPGRVGVLRIFQCHKKKRKNNSEPEVDYYNNEYASSFRLKTRRSLLSNLNRYIHLPLPETQITNKKRKRNV